MRRVIHKKTTTPFKAILYAILGLALAIYAIPKLPVISFSLSGIFTIVWLLFTFLFIASNLYYLFGVDKEARQPAESVGSDKIGHHRKVLMHE